MSIKTFLQHTCVFGFCTISIFILPLHSANSKDLNVRFYTLSENAVTSRSSLWQITDHVPAKALFTINSLATTEHDIALSDHEQGLLKSAINNGGFSTDAAYPKRLIRKMLRQWPLGDSHFLLQITNAICDPIYSAICYGYDELIDLDVNQPQTPRSLLKIDYHDKMLDSWTGCLSKIPQIHFSVTDVVPNPTQNKLALIIKGSGCYSNLLNSLVFMIDFSSSVLKITQMPLADGLSWSPDGTQFAYFSLTDCQYEICNLSFNVLSAQNVNSATLVSARASQRQQQLLSGWVNNNLIVFRWPKLLDLSSNYDDYEIVTKYFNLKIAEQLELTGSNYSDPSGDFYLIKGSFMFVGTWGVTGNSPASQSSLMSSMVTNFANAKQVFFNSRYPDKVILSDQQNCIQSATVIDSTLTQFSLDLSRDFPANECVTDLSLASN